MADKTLDERIADAGRAGDWSTVDELNAHKLTDLISRAHPATGAIARAPVTPAVVVSAPEPPAGSFDGGARAYTPSRTLDEEIARAQATGDWTAVDAANAQKLLAAVECRRAAE